MLPEGRGKSLAASEAVPDNHDKNSISTKKSICSKSRTPSV